MTRDSFWDSINSWDELLDFCRDYYCPVCDDKVYSEEARDDIINGRLEDIVLDVDGWRGLATWLDDIPTGYDYYVLDEDDGWYGADSNYLDDYKDFALNWMDDYGDWGEEEYYDDSEDTTPLEEEDIPIDELFSACRGELGSIDAKPNEELSDNEAIDNSLEKDCCQRIYEFC